MKVLILAAGYGTRLQAISKNTAKPLLPINGKPLIDFILDRIVDLKNLTEIIVVTNSKFYADFQNWARSHKQVKIPIQVLNDGSTAPENRLGSIGDINFVLHQVKMEEDLLVVGGDNLFDYSLADYTFFAQKNRPAATIGLYDIGNLSEATKYGVVAIDAKGKVTSFEEKPPQPKSTFISMCCYYFPVASFSLVKRYLESSNKSDLAGDYIKWLSLNSEVYGFKFNGKWYDIGSVESYHEAQAKFKS